MVTKYQLPTDPNGLIDNIEAFDDLGAIIANPPTDRATTGAIGQSGQKFCDFLGATPQEALNLLGPGYWGGVLLCKPYWDSQSYDPPVEAPPFFGGQCAGSEYRPLGTYTNTNAAAGPTGIRNWRLNTTVVGPISGFVPAGTPTGTSWGFLSASNGGAPFGNAVDTGNGKPIFGPNNTSGPSVMRSAGAPTITDVGLQFGPDNCGSPPAALEPGDSPPPTPVFGPGEGPGVGPNGKPFFTVPDIPSPITGGEPVGIGDQPEGSPGGPGTPPPGPPGGTEGNPVDTGAGGEGDGESEEDEELVGLRIDILSTPPNAPQYGDGLYRAVCFVFVGNENGLDLDPAGSSMRSGQMVLAERPRLTKWLVSANVGFNLRVTPYYRKIES